MVDMTAGVGRGEDEVGVAEHAELGNVEALISRGAPIRIWMFSSFRPREPLA